ncbi:mucin-binding protein [Lactobacillus gasseri]|uniref:Mucus binding protein n=1 Tax=Lactobacillus gasseri SV-16A-US TaxID=575604 RepID=A0AB34NZ86_LACGS|nr:glutamine amidotransferase [Lactobacillus gasseri]KFL97019.1 putative mucus binding protein [Lactobacillus gasseri SV-16A-US]MCZ3948598.1 hypothetical protein [Lactobacillus gasseri]QTH65473.1 hypothetical protein J3E66_000044 [Lactobacillus gasseri]RGL13855.1 hypothetical protein DXC77_09290 [Lactobacillus gasseri]
MSVVVKYIDLDNNSAELASSETLNGKVGERVNYHTAEEVQKLIAAGYVLVNNPFDLNNEVHFFNETSQEYKLTFKHAQEEVTAKNLKYDCQLGDVQLKGKQVVHYTGLEKNIADNIVEVTFNRKIIYDKVTKQKVSLSAWQPEKYYLPLIATPAVLDYTPDKTVIGGEAVTVQKPKHEYVVTYLPNKKNARRQKAEIKFIDVDNNNQELASSGELKGKPGKEISYSTTETLKELSDKGYEVINNDFDSKDQKPVFGNSRDYIQTFIIALRHKKQAVNSDHPSSEIDHRLYEKEVHRKITFSGLSGQKLDDIVQTAVLKRSLTMDMVTKKIIQGEYTSQWQSTETYPSVAVPVVAGYHTKTKEVVACPVVEEDLSEDIKCYANGYLIPVDANHNKLSEIDKKQLITNSINPTKAIFPKLELENIVLKPIKGVEIKDPGRDYEVPYLLVHKYIAVDEKHPREEVSPAYYRRIVTARVHYQGAGDQTPADAEQIVTWTRTVTYDEVSREVIDNGMYTTEWLADKDIFEATPTPVIKGFCADIGLIGEHPVTETDLMATVTYMPVGRMIPVDEHGNEIKNAMRSPYINDPYDPVRVLFTEEVPEVQGYALVNNTISVNDPFSDTKVTYTLKSRYIPVNSEHPYRPIKPTMYSVPVKETVKYQGADEQTPIARLQAARWTRTLTVDENTSELIDNGKYTTAWKVDKNRYAAVKTPIIDGYHADKNIIEAKEVKKADLDFTVIYKANGRIVPVDAKGNLLASVDQPSYVTDPEDATKVLPKQGVPRIMNYVPEQEVITVGDASEDTLVRYYTFNEWGELKAKKAAEQKQKDLKTKKPIENKDEQEKMEKVEERQLKSAEEEKKSEKKDTGFKSMFSWLK